MCRSLVYWIKHILPLAFLLTITYLFITYLANLGHGPFQPKWLEIIGLFLLINIVAIIFRE